MTGEVINTPERFAKWERELAKRQLSPEDAARERTQWSSDQDVRDTRWGTPEEIANPIVFDVSDAASYINGGELVADNAMDKSWNSNAGGSGAASACVRQRPLRLRAKRQ
jgi:3-oxoacyl-[acyl-carrier protein] reductase